MPIMPPTPATVRSSLVEALRLDLVGPEPDSEHEREVLPIPPSAWYLTGFLVPFQAKAEERCDPEAQEGIDEARPPSATDDDETPEKSSGRRVYLPSSIGVSVLVPPDAESFEATVCWGDYKAEEVVEEGRSRPRLHWHRNPGRAVVQATIPAPGARPLHVPVPDGDGLHLVLSARQAVNSTTPGGLPSGTVAVSVFLVNHRDPAPDKLRDEGKVFQAGFRLRCDQPLVPRPDPRRFGEEQWDERVADLQYRDVVEYAVGHGVAAHAEPDEEGCCFEVHTTWLPTAEVEKVDPAKVQGVQFGMEALAEMPDAPTLQAALENLVSEYRDWQGRQLGEIPKLEDQDREEMAQLLLDRAAFAADRIEAGIALLAKPMVFEAFRTANRVMAAAARQRESQWRAKPPKQVPAPHWRPFQLAFVLMNLRGVLHPEHHDRSIVDLLFFPTGGGKTEAYLGLAAFTLVWRRLRDPSIHSAGLTVLMRYTLRLLTLDQLGRAAGLICALELERQEREDELGTWPFEIGMWVGQAATPNRMGFKNDRDKYSARTRTIAFQNNTKKPCPIPLESCPWCGADFTPRSFRLHPRQDRPTDLRIVCMNRDCAFTRNNFLPILTVDEPIYRRLPCFMVATVDKFAGLPWVGESGALLGKAERYDQHGFYGPATPHRGDPLERPLPPPALIIQDELHLISGPLGTVAGFYEAAIDHLCTRHEDGTVVRPKIVASTATVRRADTQIQAIFGRSHVEVFPPPGPDRRDSFFAETVSSDKKNARLYLGVAAQGRSMKVTLLRTYLALMAAGQRAWLDAGGAKNTDNPADPYMTLLGYFNSLRELGGSRRIVEDEVKSRLSTYSFRRRVGESGSPFADRGIVAPVELTSRETTNKVAEAKKRLAVRFDDAKRKDRVDVALATNMISVGLDITRLGLMVVLAQPKTSAEYIQATSRVGRDEGRPGLVVTLLNMHRPRDRSHYERFEAFHQVFYRMVEATSVTPFAPRAIDRCVAAVTVAMARHGHPGMTHARRAAGILDTIGELDFVAEALAQRAENHAKGLSPAEAAELRHKLKERVGDLLDDWFKIADRKHQVGGGLQYAPKESGQDPHLLRQPLDPELPQLPAEDRKFKAHRSMRDVEPVVNLWARTLDNIPLPDEEAEA